MDESFLKYIGIHVRFDMEQRVETFFNWICVHSYTRGCLVFSCFVQATQINTNMLRVCNKQNVKILNDNEFSRCFNSKTSQKLVSRHFLYMLRCTSDDKTSLGLDQIEIYTQTEIVSSRI